MSLPEEEERARKALHQALATLVGAWRNRGVRSRVLAVAVAEAAVMELVLGGPSDADAEAFVAGVEKMVRVYRKAVAQEAERFEKARETRRGGA